jgi:EF hand
MVSKLAHSLVWVTLGAAAVVLSAGVLAQTAQPAPDKPAAAPESTATGNTEIWRFPSQAVSARLFDLLDRNRDGYLSPAELANRQGDWIAVDSNRDGRISRSEFKALR